MLLRQMRVVVIGNMGYVGPVIARELRFRWPDATLIGIDAGFYANCLATPGPMPEVALDQQIFADVREIEALPPCDAVVYLAALSNDVLGSLNESVTFDVNHRCAIRASRMAKEAGAHAFVFASSCSVYGFSDDAPRTEASEVNPLTAYARSKVMAERDLEPLASAGFTVTCLRFGTACGMSERLRVDLVLNDFVSSAVWTGKIRVLSDGRPWRPLVDVADMARATAWAISRNPENGGPFLVVNVGTSEFTFQIGALAEVVASRFPGVAIEWNRDAEPDRRSYRVDFSLFGKLAPEHQPQVAVEESISEIVAGLNTMSARGLTFERSRFLRIATLERLRMEGRLSPDLSWEEGAQPCLS